MRRFSYHTKVKMPLEIVVGDILENQSEVLVMPLAPRNGRLSKFAKTVYNAAGYENMKNAREEIGEMSKGKAAYTSGFGLSAKYVVHVSVPEWHGGFSDEPKHLTHCYRNAIKCAVSLNAKSISFPLLGSGLNRVPPEKAKTIAVDAIQGELRNMSYELNVFLVISPEINEELCGVNAQKKDTTEDFPTEFYYECINSTIGDEDFTAKSSFMRSTISRLRNGKIRKTQKRTTIVLSLLLNFTQQDRIKFINSAGYDYPSDALDLALEEIIEKSYENNTRDNIVDINIDLYNTNTEWALIKTKE